MALILGKYHTPPLRCTRPSFDSTRVVGMRGPLENVRHGRWPKPLRKGSKMGDSHCTRYSCGNVCQYLVTGTNARKGESKILTNMGNPTLAPRMYPPPQPYPITITVPFPCFMGLMVAVMNFATIGIYVQVVGDEGAWEYAQGFWMTICSAVMSTVCAVLLAINSFALPKFGKRGKMGLSGPQRVFVIQIMLFISWLAMYPKPPNPLTFRLLPVFCFVCVCLCLDAVDLCQWCSSFLWHRKFHLLRISLLRRRHRHNSRFRRR